MNKGTEQSPLTVHRQIACRPDCRGTDIAREDGILGGKVAQYSGNVLRVDLLVMRILGRKIIKALPCLLIMLD